MYIDVFLCVFVCVCVCVFEFVCHRGIGIGLLFSRVFLKSPFDTFMFAAAYRRCAPSVRRLLFAIVLRSFGGVNKDLWSASRICHTLCCALPLSLCLCLSLSVCLSVCVSACLCLVSVYLHVWVAI